METRNLKEVLHLYLGCEVCVTHPAASFCRDILDADLLTRLYSDELPLEYYKLILRPLSDMTEEEETEYTSLVDQWNFGFRRNMLGAATATKYLLSKHFDLFNLIPDGLAIDKNALK